MLAPPTEPVSQRSDRWHVSPDGHEFFNIVNTYLSRQDRLLVSEELCASNLVMFDIPLIVPSQIGILDDLLKYYLLRFDQ